MQVIIYLNTHTRTYTHISNRLILLFRRKVLRLRALDPGPWNWNSIRAQME